MGAREGWGWEGWVGELGQEEWRKRKGEGEGEGCEWEVEGQGV